MIMWRGRRKRKRRRRRESRKRKRKRKENEVSWLDSKLGDPIEVVVQPLAAFEPQYLHVVCII